MCCSTAYLPIPMSQEQRVLKMAELVEPGGGEGMRTRPACSVLIGLHRGCTEMSRGAPFPHHTVQRIHLIPWAVDK